RRTEAEADGHAGAEAVAVPADERGSPDRVRDHRTRRPVPGRVEIDPAAVMERRPSPDRTIEPGPAPGLDPDPAAAGIRTPTRGYVGRAPYLTVAAAVFPLAVFVEVLRAVDVLADVAIARRLGDARFARGLPRV